MVCGGKCNCGNVCRRLFCRNSYPPDDSPNETVPVTLRQLEAARDVKYTQSLAGPLTVGSYILCTGTPTEDIPWFAVNIGCGDAPHDITDFKLEIAVHFNVRFPQQYVVRNTKRRSQWGAEETTAFMSFPFKVGRKFSIEVVIDEKESIWAIDGRYYCSYIHRMPSVFLAKWIQVLGIRDATLEVRNTKTFPVLIPFIAEVPFRDSLKGSASTEEPEWLPHTFANMSNGLPVGHQLVIYGRLRSILHSFTINLSDKAVNWPYPNIHIHVNLRAHLEAQLDRQLVVLNTRFDGWGSERRQWTGKMIPGTMTTVRIVRGHSEWSVFADDVLIGELDFRASADGVRAMNIRGDLFPSAIYICPYSSSPIKI